MCNNLAQRYNKSYPYQNASTIQFMFPDMGPFIITMLCMNPSHVKDKTLTCNESDDSAIVVKNFRSSFSLRNFKERRFPIFESPLAKRTDAE